MDSLIFLTKKKNGILKAQVCANGSIQRDYISKEEAISPTAATESVLITATIDARQKRDLIFLSGYDEVGDVVDVVDLTEKLIEDKEENKNEIKTNLNNEIEKVKSINNDEIVMQTLNEDIFVDTQKKVSFQSTINLK